MNEWQLALVIIAGVIPVAALGIAVYMQDLRCRSDPRSTTESESSKQRALVKLARDVGVNVAANLIAAAVIYLLAALAGAVPRSPYLVLGALIIVSFGLSVALYALSWLLRGRAKVYLIAVMAIGSGELLGAFAQGTGLNLTEKILYLVGGAAAICLGISAILAVRNETNSREGKNNGGTAT